MGYRSDVSVVFYSRNIEKLSFAPLKLWFDENYPVKEALDEWGAKVDTGDDYILVTYLDVKWYPDFHHVFTVRSMIDKFSETFAAEESDGLASVEMVEVGEETGDIQETRSDWADYRLGVRCEIYFN
jgi:hypothetical protein